MSRDRFGLRFWSTISLPRDFFRVSRGCHCYICSAQSLLALVICQQIKDYLVCNKGGCIGGFTVYGNACLSDYVRGCGWQSVLFSLRSSLWDSFFYPSDLILLRKYLSLSKNYSDNRRQLIITALIFRMRGSSLPNYCRAFLQQVC